MDLEAVKEAEQETAGRLTGVQTNAGYKKKLAGFCIVMSTHAERAQI